jgi:hypothetical protein
MLHDYAAEKIAFVAPTIWHYEVANIINKAVGTRRLTEEEGFMAFQTLQALAIEFVPFPTPAEAYRLARTYRRSVYNTLGCYRECAGERAPRGATPGPEHCG